MSASFEDINYSLRPAKSIERKMICESLRHLTSFAKLQNYQYIGFGSPYYTDFRLFHKSLGMKKLVSIEKEITKEKRFKYNKPFNCIKLFMEHSNNILPTLNWKGKSIVWLDNDDKLDDHILSDIQTVCSSVESGSVVLISVNVKPERLNERVTDLKKRITTIPLPSKLTESKLGGKHFSDICREIMNDAIQKFVHERNGIETEENKYNYKQIYNFEYADGADMLTLGGIIYQKKDEEKVNQCEFEKLEFIRFTSDPLRIRVPSLTFREIHALEKKMPSYKLDKCKIPVPDKDKEMYSHIYRFFPTFAEADF